MSLLTLCHLYSGVVSKCSGKYLKVDDPADGEGVAAVVVAVVVAAVGKEAVVSCDVLYVVVVVVHCHQWLQLPPPLLLLLLLPLRIQWQRAAIKYRLWNGNRSSLCSESLAAKLSVFAFFLPPKRNCCRLLLLLWQTVSVFVAAVAIDCFHQRLTIEGAVVGR